MSTTLSALPASTRKRYPWPDWTDGRIHQITKGADFDIDAHDMRSTLYGYARRHQLSIEIRTQQNSVIIFRFSQENGR